MDWLDQNGRHSMTSMAVIDMDVQFLELLTGWPNSTNDQHVLHNSRLLMAYNFGSKFNGPEHVIGGCQSTDSVFDPQPWLLVPYEGTNSSNTKQEFNCRHFATWIVVERAFGLVKKKWQILYKLHIHPWSKSLQNLTFSCCLLYNIMIDRGDIQSAWEEEGNVVKDFEPYQYNFHITVSKSRHCRWI